MQARITGFRLKIRIARDSNYEFESRENIPVTFYGENSSELLEKIGSVLIYECKDDRLIRAFKSLGGTFHDFLTTLDGVHDVIQDQDQNTDDEQMTSVFICNVENDHSNICYEEIREKPESIAQYQMESYYIELFFATSRLCLAHLLTGTLKAIANRFYHTELSISMTCKEESFRYLIIPQSISSPKNEDDLDNQINEVKSKNQSLENGSDNSSNLISQIDDTKIKSNSQLSRRVADLKISVSTFCKAFPWHFLTDKNLQIVQLGSGFMKLFGRQLKQSERRSTRREDLKGKNFRLIRAFGNWKIKKDETLEIDEDKKKINFLLYDEDNEENGKRNNAKLKRTKPIRKESTKIIR
ncbi:hypothetical protein PGB90_010054 [Kerria lacca]